MMRAMARLILRSKPAAFARRKTAELFETSKKALRWSWKTARWIATGSLLCVKRLGLFGCVVVVVLAALGFEVLAARSVVQIDPFVVPKEFEEQGFTSQTILNRVVDRITAFQEVVKASRSRIEVFELANPDLPDIEIDVPATKVSFRAVVRFVQEVFHLEPPRVSGEITVVPALNSGPQHLSVTVRVTRKSEKRSVSRFDVTPAEADEVVSPLAEQILQLIDPYVLAAYVYSVEKNPKRALELCKLAIQLDTRNADAYTLWGNVLLVDHDIPGAIAKYRMAIRFSGDSFPAYSSFGVSLALAGDIDGSLAAFQKAIKLNPKDAGAYVNCGNALFLKHDPDSAIAKYKTAIALDPRLGAMVYNGWGGALVDKGDLDGALAKLQKAIEDDPKFFVAYINWGSVLYMKHHSEEAVAKFEKAIEVDPKQRAYTYSKWGDILSETGDLDGAVAKYQEAIQLDPKAPAAYISWGNVLYRKRDPDGAIAKYQKAIQLGLNAAEFNSASANAYNGWGTVLYDRHDLDGALAKYQKAIELDPHFAPPYIGWGTVLYAKHDFEGAITKYQIGVKLDTNNEVFRRDLQQAEIEGSRAR
jgi:tetratricopeptide (TPR) repeat protein